MIRATPRVQARARQIASVTGAQPVLSFATADAELPKAENVHAAISKEPLKVHACADCGTSTTVSAALTDPHCVNCGSPHLKCTAHTAVLPSTLQSDADLSAIQCSTCSTLSVLDNRVVAAVKSVHCSMCGSHLSVEAELSTASSTIQAKADTMKTAKETAAGTGVQLSEPGAAPETPVTLNNEGVDTPLVMKTDDASPETPNDHGTTVVAEAEDDLSLSEGDMQELDTLAQDLEDDVVLSWSDEDTDGDMPLDAVEEPAIDDLSLAAEMTGDTLADPIMDSVDGLDESFDMSTAEAADEEDPMALPECATGDPLMDTVGLDDTVAACFLVQAGKKLLAMKGHYTIATLTPENAGANADVMGTDAFSNAVLAQAHQIGLRKALAQFKFTPVKTTVTSAVTVKNRVEAATMKAKAELRAHLKVQADCLALAAAGLARNAFKGQANPLKAALEGEFIKCGIRQPGRVASAFLAEHGMEYAKALTAQSQKIAALSETARRQLADMLDLVSDEPVDDLILDTVDSDAQTDEMPGNDYETDFDEMATSVSARLLQPAAPSGGNRQVAALLRPGHRVNSANADAEADASAVLSGNQRLSFGY